MEALPKLLYKFNQLEFYGWVGGWEKKSEMVDQQNNCTPLTVGYLNAFPETPAVCEKTFYSHLVSLNRCKIHLILYVSFHTLALILLVLQVYCSYNLGNWVGLNSDSSSTVAFAASFTNVYQD